MPTSRRRRRTPALAVFPALLAAAGISGCAAGSEPTTRVRVLSGPAGGAWHSAGEGIAKLLANAVPQISTTSLPGSSETNITEVNAGHGELAFTSSAAAYAGFNGRPPFSEPNPNLRHFATLYTTPLQTAVRRRSNIYGYEDLASKGISPGQVGLSGTALAEQVLAEYGISFESVERRGGAVHHLDYAEAGALMKDGYIEALIALADVPLPSMVELSLQPGIRLLPIEPRTMSRLLAANPALVAVVIPRDAYDGISADVPTIGVAASLVVHKDLPEEIVYRMAQAFWVGQTSIEDAPPAWRRVSLENALLAAAIPVHPGAQRFYDEMGVSHRRQ